MINAMINDIINVFHIYIYIYELRLQSLIFVVVFSLDYYESDVFLPFSSRL